MTKRKATKQHFRHENGFGSIVKLSGHRRKPYGVRITVGWKDGKQVRKYLGYYKSEAEALIALAEFHKSGASLDLTKLTLSEVFYKWYGRIENKVSKSALENHNMVKSRLGKLGDKPIKDIKVDHLQDWFDSIKLKPRTKILMQSTMNQVFEYAIQNDILNKNPVKYVEISEKVEETGAVFTENETNYLLENADNDEDLQTILILIYTGTRISELLELRTEHFHLDEGYAIGGNKTTAGKSRIIPFHDDILPIVKHRIEKYGCIVPDKNGEPLAYRGFNYRFKKMMKTLNWEHTIHDTRKTAISIMHRAGIPMETIRVIVGHSGKGVTERVYLFIDPRELVAEVNKVQLKAMEV